MIDIKTFIKKHEGYRKHAYLDSKGIWTTGVGFNLERAGAKAALAKAGVNYDMIWAAIEECKKAGGGRKPGEHTAVDVLTDEQVDKLLLADIADSVADCKKICPQMDKWPQEAQAVLVDLHFNMGPTTLRTFKNTLKAFNDQNWALAADNLTKSLWFKQVGIRATENVGILRALAPPKPSSAPSGSAT